MKRSGVLVVLLIMTVFASAPAGVGSPARVIYVDANAPGADNGTSWGDAYNYLQDALADANSLGRPVEIRVAQGVYTPDSNSATPNGSGDRHATFQLISGASLRGGYAGFGRPDPNTRDVEKYETVLSGDLNDDDVWGAPWDVDRGSLSDNSRHVVTARANDETAVIDGFFIEGGVGGQKP